MSSPTSSLTSRRKRSETHGPIQGPPAQARPGPNAPTPGQSPQDPSGQTDPGAMALVKEAQQIQQRLATIGQQVMEEPAVAEQLESLQ